MSRPRLRCDAWEAVVPSSVAMTLARRFLARLLELPPADTHDVLVERDLEIPCAMA